MRLEEIDMWWPVWLAISIVLYYLGKVNIWTVVLIVLSHIHIKVNLKGEK